MPHLPSTTLLDLETELFASDPSTASVRALAFAHSVPPRPPRPASLKPMAFVPRPPEWQRFPNGIGCEAVLLRARRLSTATIAAQAA
jgi:hypothetical protein